MTFIMRRTCLFFLFVLFATLSSFAQNDVPDAPNPPRLVNDFAGILSRQTVANLERELVSFDTSTSTQIVVVTVASFGDLSANEFATKLGHKWGVGQKGKSNGVVILVKPKPANGTGKGEAYIAPGYGLEGALPDIICHRIVNEVMIPYFRTGDYNNGVIAACKNVMDISRGEYTSDRTDEPDIVSFIIILLFIALFIYFLRKNKNNKGYAQARPRRGHVTYGDIISTSRNDRWHDNFGGGGFGGGGFGGGGFGGFGGGSFGGGGSGGSW